MAAEIVEAAGGERMLVDAPEQLDDRRAGMRVPRFVIDLDAAPEERWLEVCRVYAPDFLAIKQQIEDLIAAELGPKLGPFLKTVLSSFLSLLTKMGIVFYGDELQGMATATGMPLGTLVLLQLVYEASAHCTSIVVHSPDGTPHHIRTMDWQMDFLKPLTVEFEFVRGGRVLFVAPSWAGYCGVLTGIRPQCFSVSVNFRLTDGGYWQNVKRALGRAWPIGFLLREVFASESTSYAEAVAILATSDVIAPVYFTVCGINPGEGVVLTRDRSEEAERWELARGAVVQTNMDHFSSDPAQSVMLSLERRVLARSVLDAAHDELAEDGLWQLISQSPILNEITVYGAYMKPATGRLLTIIPDGEQGFLLAEDHGADEPPRVVGDAARVACTVCGARVTPSLNPTGLCGHSGDWHSEYAHCSKIKCGWKLKTNIGKCHWSCCFSVVFDSSCPKSAQHVLP